MRAGTVSVLAVVFVLSQPGCGDNENDLDLDLPRDAATTPTPDATLACVEDSDCDDSVDCTDDACVANACVYTADSANCDDGVACTDDACNSALGCQFTANNANCNDSVACTDDACDATLGCQFTANNAGCSDGVACTDDTCDATLGCQFTANNASCSDGVACTDDTCDTALGCQFTANNANCSDGVGCTDDTCDTALGCRFSANNANCNDGVGCTDDACDAANDCQFTANNARCNDGIGCTDDSCDATYDCRFIANNAYCNDGVGCTDDMCNPSSGCQYIPDDTACDDGVLCTADTCDAVDDCEYTADDTRCDDRVDCTPDVCDPSSDCVNTPPSGYVADFESGAQGWTSGLVSGTVNGWALNTEAGGSAPQQFSGTMIGTPNAGPELGQESSYLESPVIDLTGGGLITFDVYIANERDPGRDAEALWVSYDGGTTFSILIPSSDPSWRVTPSGGFSIGFRTITQAVPLGTSTTVFRFTYDTTDATGSPGTTAGFFVDDFIATNDPSCKITGCPFAAYDAGPADLVNGIRTFNWNDNGIMDSFSLAEPLDMCSAGFEFFFQPGATKHAKVRVRIYAAPNGMASLGPFASAVPVFDHVFVDGTDLTFFPTGTGNYGYEIWRYEITPVGTLPAGNYAFHITFPSIGDHPSFWATAPQTGSECTHQWGTYITTPQSICSLQGSQEFENMALTIQ